MKLRGLPATSTTQALIIVVLILLVGLALVLWLDPPTWTAGIPVVIALSFATYSRQHNRRGA